MRPAAYEVVGQFRADEARLVLLLIVFAEERP
jgi:hypothetical protein